MLTPREQEILAELVRREGYDPGADCFPAQRALVDDDTRFLSVLCARRSGKTQALVRRALRKLRKPGARVLYIALTLDSARRLYWGPFKDLCEKYGCAVSFNETRLEATFDNGPDAAPSFIFLRGAEDKREIEKFRGDHFDEVQIDESASFDIHMDGLIKDVIRPALADRRGSFVVAGTPSAGMTGFFFDVTRPDDLRNKAWKLHKWSNLDNTNLPALAEERENVLKEYGWTIHTPRYRREWLGEWARADDELVYRYDPAKNHFEKLPGGFDWICVLGVDIGAKIVEKQDVGKRIKGRSAFVLGAYCRDLPHFYVVDQFAEFGMIPTTIAEKIRYYRENFDVAHVVMDCGALGKGYAEEFRQVHALPIEAAEKTDKDGAIRDFNDGLARGRIFADKNSEIVKEWNGLQYAEDGKEDPRCKNDLSDAGLYAFRKSKHYLAEPETARQGPVSAQQETEEFWKREEERMKREREENDAFGGL